MLMQTRGPGAGWNWLVGSCNMLRRRPGKLLGAAALVGLCLFIPSVLQLLARPRGYAIPIVLGAGALLSSVLYPLLIGGFMRLLHTVNDGGDARVAQVFDLFRPGRGGSRMVLFGLCMLLAYVVFLALILAAVGHTVVPWYLDLISRQSSGLPMTGLPALPAGFGPTLALVSVFFLFYGGAVAIGTGQVALGGQPPLAAFRDGITGAFKNVLPLVVLVICGVVALLVFAIVVGILIVILLALAHFVSNALGLALAGIVYFGMLLLIVAFTLGINYSIWRDVAGTARDAAADGADA